MRNGFLLLAVLFPTSALAQETDTAKELRCLRQDLAELRATVQQNHIEVIRYFERYEELQRKVAQHDFALNGSPETGQPGVRSDLRSVQWYQSAHQWLLGVALTGLALPLVRWGFAKRFKNGKQ